MKLIFLHSCNQPGLIEASFHTISPHVFIFSYTKIRLDKPNYILYIKKVIDKIRTDSISANAEIESKTYVDQILLNSTSILQFPALYKKNLYYDFEYKLNLDYKINKILKSSYNSLNYATTIYDCNKLAHV
ncbi:hypothetical protein [Carp edema virus]|nr:hypothetical protein [Carp edema virus]